MPSTTHSTSIFLHKNRKYSKLFVKIIDLLKIKHISREFSSFSTNNTDHLKSYFDKMTTRNKMTRKSAQQNPHIDITGLKTVNCI